jgi:hypothetical protein
MAVYKIFPTKDATIYSQYPSKNTGLDEILETTTTVNNLTAYPQTSRFLVQFDSTEINDIINNKISGSQWQANFRGFLANLEGLFTTTTLEFYPISATWNMGTGRYNYNPEVTDGASWVWRSYSGSNAWAISGFPTNVTASYGNQVGGGNWYYTSSNTTILPIYSTQSFAYTDSGDIDTNITNMVKAWYSGSIVNNGLIAKQTIEFVNNEDYQTKMQFFSRDTSTIYPPQLEFRWRDYKYNTGSSNITELNTTIATVSIDENVGVFYPESINRFRVNSRPSYPTRAFQTSSYFTQNYYLPTSSYYAIKDLDTNEFVVDFDDQYTQLSVDNQSSYFTLYMNGLEPERYYKILIKSVINGSTIVFDNNYYFKVVNG